MDDLEQIIADQMAQIGRMRAEMERYREDLTRARTRLHGYELGRVRDPDDGDDPYWTGVYDRIRAAWDKWALAEIGTTSPSPLDLQGRPELAELWESIR